MKTLVLSLVFALLLFAGPAQTESPAVCGVNSSSFYTFGSGSDAPPEKLLTCPGDDVTPPSGVETATDASPITFEAMATLYCGGCTPEYACADSPTQGKRNVGIKYSAGQSTTQSYGPWGQQIPWSQTVVVTPGADAIEYEETIEIGATFNPGGWGHVNGLHVAYGGFGTYGGSGTVLQGSSATLVWWASFDLDQDGCVGISDYSTFSQLYLAAPDTYYRAIDYNFDDEITVVDFSLFSQHYLDGCS